MQRPREQFFASPRFAQQQNGRSRRCNLFNGAAYSQHLRVRGEDAGKTRRFGSRLQPSIFFLDLMQTKRTLDGERKQIRLERLCVKIVGTKPDRLQRVRAVVLPGKHDYLRVWCQRKNLLKQREAFGRIVRMWG